MNKLSMDELNRVSVEEFKEQEKFPVVIILDSVRSLNNVGAAFRTCDAFAVEKLILCGITGCPPHREIQKTALGATESVNWEYIENITDAITILQNNGYQVVAVEQTNKATMLQNLTADKNTKIAFIFGNEVEGVSQEAVEQADFAVEIPQFGTKHSLNVSVTLGIVLWHFIYKTNF